MKSSFRTRCALALVPLVLLTANVGLGRTTAVRQLAQPEPVSPGRAAVEDSQPLTGEEVPWEEYEGPVEGFDGYGGEECDTCWAHGRCVHRGMMFGGAEYLLARPRFSEANAFFSRELISDQTSVPEVSTLVDRGHEFDFDYQSSFRTYLGYRLCDCGGEVQFTYWRLTGDAETLAGPADITGGTFIIAGQLEVNPGQGEFLRANMDVTANIYDLDFSKCLPFGGPTSYCDPCGCPRWDLRWLAGIRAADIHRNAGNAIVTANGSTTTFGDIQADFAGAGPRLGFQGRRYIGQTGWLSIYAKGSMALLIGEYEMRRVRTTPGSPTTATVITVQEENYNRMVPVSEIEVGGSYQMSQHLFVSAGWFFQSWWDLGASEQVGGTNFLPLDDSNIMGWDGLFIRAEMTF